MNIIIMHIICIHNEKAPSIRYTLYYSYSIIYRMKNAAFYITLKLIQLECLILFDQSKLSIPY